MTDRSISVHEPHTIARFVRQDGEAVKGCTCQVWPSDVEIDDGEISHLAEKRDGCPYEGATPMTDDLWPIPSVFYDEGGETIFKRTDIHGDGQGDDNE